MADPIIAILVGCGGVSREWLDAVRDMPDVRMAGFVDIREEAARDRAAEYGWHDAVVGSDLADVLARARPQVVFDCTVPEAHVSVTLEALRYGCHVLGEKPLADSLAHARAMVEAAQGAGKVYAVMQNRRFDANIRRLCRFLATGAIGPVTTVHCDYFMARHIGGFRDRMAHPLLLDMAIHTFDAARLICGADPQAVYCKEWNPAGSWYDGDASAVAVFEMTGGVVYTYRGSWCAEGLNTTWESEWRIIGTAGSMKWDGAEGFQAQAVAEWGGYRSRLRDLEIPPAAPEDKAGGHAGLIRDFVRCLRTGATPETISADNIKSLAMVFGAIESAECGERVAIG